MKSAIEISVKLSLVVAFLSLVTALGLFLTGYKAQTGPFMIALFASTALYCLGRPSLKNFSFTVWVFAFVATAMYYPAAFGTWFGLDLKVLIVPLIQIIMFGMGTTLSMVDFGRVFTMPRPVLIGLVLQFSVMPLAGLAIALSFGFEPEIAAGIILIGSCPGGVASNLMTYLAGGDVALSVTMTSCSTLVSPVATPFLMKTLAGRFVPIDFVAMMLSILNMIIVPIVAGLAANQILYGKSKWAGRAGSLSFVTALGICLAALALFTGASSWGPLAAIRQGVIIGFALIAVVALAKLVVSVWFEGPENWMDKTLPIVSMSGICFIIAIITARSSDMLLTVGPALIAASVIHNFTGYILGYWIAKLGRMDEKTSRTVAFEVGMQNGGMASGLAISVLENAKAALAPAIFGPWMNVSGSMLATWWHGRPSKDQEAVSPVAGADQEGETS